MEFIDNEEKIKIPSGLNYRSSQAVVRFAEAVAKKLRDAEIKYGYSDGWTFSDWEEKCRKELMEHIVKGDPRDVAIYAMFMWHHGWSTSRPARFQSSMGYDRDGAGPSA